MQIPKLGWVRMHEPLRFVGRIREAIRIVKTLRAIPATPTRPAKAGLLRPFKHIRSWLVTNLYHMNILHRTVSISGGGIEKARLS